MSELNIEINGMAVSSSIFSVLEEIARNKLHQAKCKQITQRENIAVERDAARIAGKLTEDFYRMIDESV